MTATHISEPTGRMMPPVERPTFVLPEYNLRALAMRNRHGKGEDLDSLRSEIESIAAGSEEASRKVDARVETVKGQIADNADRRAKLQHARDSLKAKVVKLRVSIPASLVEDVKNGKDFLFAGEIQSKKKFSISIL